MLKAQTFTHVRPLLSFSRHSVHLHHRDSANSNVVKKNALWPAGAGGRHCPCRTFLRPVGNAVVSISNRQSLGPLIACPRKICQRPRASHMREVLAHTPHSNASRVSQELWIEGDRRLYPFHPVSMCAHHARSDKRAEVVCIQPAPACPRLEVTPPRRPALRRLRCSVGSDCRHHRRAFPWPVSRRDGFASTRKGPLPHSPAFPNFRLYLTLGGSKRVSVRLQLS